MNLSFESHGFFLLRTAAFDKAGLEKVLNEPDEVKAQKKLKQIISGEEFQSYLRFYQPDLAGMDPDEILDSLYRFLVRLTLRPTPLGCQAGVAWGKTGELTGITSHSSQKVMAERTLPVEELLLANPTARFHQEQLLYLFWKDHGGVREITPSVLKSSEFVTTILNFLRSPKPAASVKKLVQKLTGNEEKLQELIDLRLIISSKDSSALFDSREVVAQAPATFLKSLPDRNSPVQHVLVREHEKLTLGKTEINSVRGALSILHRCFGRYHAFDASNLMIEKFKLRFLETYREQRVPLEKLLEELYFAYPKVEETFSPVLHHHEKLNQFLSSRMAQAFALENGEWELSNEEIVNLENIDRSIDVPGPALTNWGVCVYGNVLRTENKNLIVHYRYGLTGTSLSPLSRDEAYLSGLETELRKISKLELSEDEAIIFADLNHVPHLRGEAVSRRKRFLDYEIELSGVSTLSREKVITLDDLEVFLSGTYFLLYSRRLKKIVFPVVTHNFKWYQDENPVARFLYGISRQYLPPSIHWPWLPGLVKTPRISYKNVILSLRHWTFGKDEFNFHFTEKEFRTIHGLPDILELVQPKGHVTLNLNHTEMVRAQLEKVSGQELSFVECLTDHSTLIPLATEFVLPFSVHGSDNIGLTSLGRERNLRHNDSDFAAVTIILSPLFRLEFLKRITSPLSKDGFSFFYLFYPSSVSNRIELRIRILSSGKAEIARNLLTNVLGKMLQQFEIFSFAFSSFDEETDIMNTPDGNKFLYDLYAACSKLFVEELSNDSTDHVLQLHSLNLAILTSMKNKLNVALKAPDRTAIGKYPKVLRKKLREKTGVATISPELLERAKDLSPDDRYRLVRRLLHLNVMRIEGEMASEVEKLYLEILN